MSIVSSQVSENNPITAADVRDAAASLGFEVKDSEIEAHRTLLAAAYETFEELSALPDYELPEDGLEIIREDILRIEEGSNFFANAWSYRCTIEAKSTCGNLPAAKLLAGKRIVVKDNICIAGIPQVYGTDAISPWTPQSDATVVTRILEAGGRIVGTATCEAMSCATVSNTASAGPVYNPYAPEYSAGGSSSGIGALVGNPDQSSHADAVDMGMGADQGGSIRVPAAFCGLVGLKATHGLIPYTGVIPCEAVLDHVGPMCRTVWDTAVLLEVVAGYDGIDDRQLGAQSHGGIKYSSNLKKWYENIPQELRLMPLAGRRVAVIKEAIDAPFVMEEMKAEIRAAAERFQKLGAILEEISMPSHELGRSLWMAVCRQSLTSVALGHPMGRRGHYPTGYFASILPWSQEKWDRLPIAMRNELINGVFEQKQYPTMYAKCMNLALRLRTEYQTLFDSFDVLLMPTVPFTAPRLFDRATASPWEIISSTFGQTLNTMQFNLTGHPAMSLPIGLKPDMSGTNRDIKLPVALQLIGPLHGESKLLEFGYAYEKAYDWKENR
ncbi:putative amidase [Thozetella sp. PMI_491]|nr:putative amidase [Thozetella sp. PMI_491]